MEIAQKIGILGGGQLAAMLATAGRELGVEAHVYSTDSEPCAEKFGFKVHRELKSFLRDYPIVVFENEFVDCDSLENAAQGGSVQFIPALKVIRQLQDKFQQKKILTELGIPTAPFVEISTVETLEPQIDAVLQRFQGCVFKWARLGYDGKGVFICENGEADLGRLIAFCQRALQQKSVVYVEEKIDFKRELACVTTVSSDLQAVHYPLVISEQEQGICKRVYGPARKLGVSPELEKRAHRHAEALAGRLGITGTFAIEYFETAEGELLVNEIAPRVHNSGHYTLDASATDQFSNHLRAALGMKLGSSQSTPGFAMLNLLGPENVRIQSDKVYLPTPHAGTVLHWYRKSEIRPGRKLGHVNGTVENLADINRLLNELDQYEKQWISSLRGIHEAKK